MKFQPCFGYHLKGAVRIIYFANMAHIIIPAILLVVDVVERLIRHYIMNENQFPNFTVYLWTFLAIVFSTFFTFNIFLGKNHSSENFKGLYLWSISILVLNTIFCAIYVKCFLHLQANATVSVHWHWQMIFEFFAYVYYTCIVVYCYTKELRTEFHSRKELVKYLTEEEILEFETGNDIDKTLFGDLEDKMDLEATIISKRYLKETFEISLENIILEKTNLLGRGSFGEVYKAELCNDDLRIPKFVAVKTMDHEICDAKLLKVLLNELKVMSYIGHHKNIVSLIGACTSEIRIGKLYVVVELCHLGSLLYYIKHRRGWFLNQVKNGIYDNNAKSMNMYYANFEEQDKISTSDFLTWAYQIADGMAYLESKKVVHGDLATRNILLSDTRYAKITDFGLSRRLYQYEMYSRNPMTPVPWRWMSIESIADFNFSSKSDVWSYGVTIWEMFSFCEIPWENEISIEDFLDKLKRGQRLEMLANVTEDIYKLLFRCWSEHPKDRPCFEDLSIFFRKQYSFLAE